MTLLGLIVAVAAVVVAYLLGVDHGRVDRHLAYHDGWLSGFRIGRKAGPTEARHG